MSVRAKPIANQRKLISLRLIIGIVAVFVGGFAVFGFYKYSANLGLGSGPLEIEVTSSGRIIKVPTGTSIQKAVDLAVGGDTIELQAGATYPGKIRLKNHSGDDFVTIRTSAGSDRLPAEDVRLDPKRYAASLPKIVSTIKGEPAVVTTAGAHHYRFIGIDFGPTPDGLYNIIELGTTEETSLAQLPHHIEFDRVYLHGDPKVGQRRGIAANGKFIKITNSYFSDFKREGEESQAIAMWATDGPTEITNNYLEAAAESILFGGAENAMKLVASDCIVRDNWLNKSPEWRGSKWVVKNFLEIKSGRRIKIENNLMTNNWAMAQEGTGVLFRSAVDSGPQAIVEDIEYTNNIMRSSGSALNIFGGEGQGGRNLTIRNNVFEDISAKKYEGRGYFIKSTTFDNVIIENNTVIHDGSIAIAYGAPVTGMKFRNNIVFNNEYGFFGDGLGVGKPVLAKYFPSILLTNNVIIGGSASDYGSANIYLSGVAQLGFQDPTKGDYRLRESSTFLTKGYGGKAVGANLDPKTVGGKF